MRTVADRSLCTDALRKKLEENPLKPWFNPFRAIKARLVRGTPWLEDMYRYPSVLLRVEFVAPDSEGTPAELSEENLYTLFRRFGKISEITAQPFDSKATPRFAWLAFPSVRDSIMARNCMHGFVASEALGGGKTGTRLRISYQKRMNPHGIWNWLSSHPRIIIPVIAFLVAGISVIIFDPIRQFFIRLHVQHSFHLTESRIWQWFKSQTDQFSLGARKKQQQEGLNTVWNHRRDLIEQLQGWLEQSSDSFIVVMGPRGSGKLEMVRDKALEGRKNILMIDCKPIVDARGESGTIGKLAAAVGYRPIFSWANSISSLVDLAVQSTTGVKAGFSETMDTQLNKILQTTAAALKDVAVAGRSKKDKDANLSEDAYLEAHPERKPIIVIDNFLHRNEEKSIVYEKVAEWAASMVQSNVAHVIFLTSDSSYTKPLTKALPDRVFRMISLGDLDPQVAKNFVIRRLEEESHPDEKDGSGKGGHPPPPQLDLSGLDACIQKLGGRLTDLEFFTRRLRTGQSPQEAVEEIVRENATDIVRMFLFGRTGDLDRVWSPQQVWHLIKTLGETPVLRYHQVLLSPVFASSTTEAAKNGELALEGLASSELIAIKSHHGRPQSITAGKPLHQAAFAELLRDPVLRARMDLAVLGETVKIEAKTIDSAEAELALLGSLPRQTGETGGRVVYLLGKLDASQQKIALLDKEIVAMKKVLNEEF